MARQRDPNFMDRLAQAGLAVFARDGLANARMSDVAQRLGVSQGTLYNYVESKEALFCIALDRATGAEHIPLPDTLPVQGPSIDSIRQGLEEDAAEVFRLERLDQALQKQGCEDVAEELRGILEEFHDRLEATRWAADVIERSAQDIPELHDLFFMKLRRSVLTRLSRYLSLRMEQGCLAPVGDPDVAARLIAAVIDYSARGWHRDPDPMAAELEGYGEEAVRLVVQGLVGESKGAVPLAGESFGHGG